MDEAAATLHKSWPVEDIGIHIKQALDASYGKFQAARQQRKGSNSLSFDPASSGHSLCYRWLQLRPSNM